MRKAIVLLSHGDFGKAVLDSAQMLIGDIRDCFAVPLYEAESLEYFMNQAVEKIIEYERNVLLMSDFFGGTAMNVAVKLGYQYDVPVVNGLSLELFIIAYRSLQKCRWEELTEEIINCAKEIHYDVKKECEEFLDKK